MADESLVKTDGVNVESLINNGIKSKADIAVMEKLFAMRNQLKAEKDKEAFYRALAKFQSETPAVPKSKAVKYDTKTGGKVDYHYAPIEIIVDTVKGALEKNGFSYTLKTEQTDTKITVTCEAHHESGHTESTSLTVPMSTGEKMNAIQQIGTAITYAKRYTFCNAFGIMTEDEDTDCVEAEIVKEEKPKETTIEKLQTQISAIMNEKLAFYQDDRSVIFYALIQKAGMKIDDYTKKTVKKVEDIKNEVILVQLLKIAQDYNIGDKI